MIQSFKTKKYFSEFEKLDTIILSIKFTLTVVSFITNLVKTDKGHSKHGEVLL